MKKIIFFIWLFTFCFLSFAEVIYLKNGNKIEGKIVEKKDDHVKVDYRGVLLTYGMGEIDCITKEEKVKKAALDDMEYLNKFMEFAAAARNLAESKFILDGKEVYFAPKADKFVWKDLINYYEGKKATLQNLRHELLKLTPPPEFFKMHEALKKSFDYAIAGYKKAIIALEKGDIMIMEKEGAELLNKSADTAIGVVYSLKKVKSQNIKD